MDRLLERGRFTRILLTLGRAPPILSLVNLHPIHPMRLLTVNLESRLIAANRAVLSSQTAILNHQKGLDAQIECLRLGAEKTFKEGQTLDAAKELGFDYVSSAAQRVNETNHHIAHLPPERVFAKDAIKKLCLTYGLRFLETRHYNGALDGDIPAKLAEFKRMDQPVIDKVYGKDYQRSYLIAAPTASFHLTPRPKDPLLFAKITADHYYLIHKWGDDLSVMARVKNWAWHIPAAVLCATLGIIGLVYACKMIDASGMSSFGLFMLSICGGVGGTIACATYESKTRVTDRNWDSPHSN